MTLNEASLFKLARNIHFNTRVSECVYVHVSTSAYIYIYI